MKRSLSKLGNELGGEAPCLLSPQTLINSRGRLSIYSIYSAMSLLALDLLVVRMMPPSFEKIPHPVEDRCRQTHAQEVPEVLGHLIPCVRELMPEWADVETVSNIRSREMPERADAKTSTDERMG